jgi:hypothetical protein
MSFAPLLDLLMQWWLALGAAFLMGWLARDGLEMWGGQ